MPEKDFTMCPGCGLTLPDKGLSANDRYHASGECFELFGQLSAYTLSLNDATFIHQLTVDAYGAQHSGGVTRNTTTAYALIGLCLAIEHHHTGRQVQEIHMRILKQTWPMLKPPVNGGPITVADVLEAQTNTERTAMIKKWTESVWDSWSRHHKWVRRKVNEYV